MNELPELPFSPYLFAEWASPTDRVCRTMFTEDQMRSYALSAVQMERERCAKLCEKIAAEAEDESPHKNYDLIALECAAAIRSPAKEGEK